MIQFFNKDYLTYLNNNKYILNLKSTYLQNFSIENKVKLLEDEYNKHIHFFTDINISKYIKSIDNLTSLELLKKENMYIKLLSKYSLQNNIFNIAFYNNILNTIFQISELLRNRLNQKEITFNKKHNTIYRSSYKFCNYKDFCTYNYSSKNSCCYQDHYVHNMVSLDIKILLHFINNKKNEEGVRQCKDILRSINTISYVINHMEVELNSKCLYQDKNTWEKYHVINLKKKKN